MGACLVEKLTGSQYGWNTVDKGHLTLAIERERLRNRTGGRQNRVAAGHCSDSGRPGLQQSWENWESVRKGAASRKGSRADPGSCLWDLRVLWSLETFASGLPVTLTFTTRGCERHTPQGKQSCPLYGYCTSESPGELLKKKKESNPGPNPEPIKVEYQGLALFTMVDADHM